MVTRTPRQSSQPRSTRAASTSRVPTFENWENQNANPRASAPAHGDRRAMSSMRHQPTSRDSKVRARGATPKASSSAGLPSYNSRPRAMSAGKLRPPEEDPAAVAKQILELRDRRENGQHLKRKDSPLGLRPTGLPSYSKSSSSRSKGSSGKPSFPQLMSNMSEDEVQSEARLKKAEYKISGLLEELEELKFFQELEHDAPPPTTPRAPQTPSRGGSSKTPRGGGSAQTPRGGGSQTPRGLGPPTPSRSGGQARDQVDIPPAIRAMSPARGGRLPPPPPANKTVPSGGLETYKPMSPRMIAKLDRNSLELECQTLVRKLQIFEQENNSKAAMIEMYEISMQEHDMDKTKIHKLESELMKVSTELKRQVQNIQKGNESLVKDYEERLQQNLKKLHRVQEIADSYKMDAEAAKAEAGTWKQDLEKNRHRAKQEKIRADDSKGREAVLELQLTEARNLNATLVKKIEKKRSEVSFLKEDLNQTNTILAESKENRDEAYEARISALQEQMTVAEEQYTKLEEESTKNKSTIQQKDVALESARVRESDQAESIEELQARVEELEKQNLAKFEEGKKAGKSQETKKLTVLVGERAKESREYERRLKGMQEQLKHQADRHHAEIQETGRRNDEKLAAMREDVKEELRIQDGDKASKLEWELSTLGRNYDEAKIDYQARLKDAQSKYRETAAEFKRQDEVRQQDLDRMHDRLENYVKETGEKDSKLTELTERLEDARAKLVEETETMRSKHRAEIMERDQKLEDEMRKFEDKEADLEDQITAMKATHSEVERRLRGQVEDLRTQVDEAHQKLVAAQSLAKENESIKTRISEVHFAFENVQEGLQKERNRHEELESELRVEIAKLEGRLRSSESNLKTSKSRIVELETQLDMAGVTSSKVGEEKQAEIKSLRKRLDESQTMLDNERRIVQENEAANTELNLEVSSLQQKLKLVSRLEEVVQELKRKNASLEYEKTQKDSELASSMKSYEETRAKLLEAEQRYTIAKADSESQAMKREKIVERYEKNIQDLEFRLENEKANKIDLESSVSEIRGRMDSLETEKIRKETELSSLRKDYEDLSSLLEENLHSSARKDEIDLQLKRREREMKETVDIYNQQTLELEDKLCAESKEKADLQSRISHLQKRLDNTEDEKTRLSSEMADLKRNLDNALSELDETRKEQETSQGGIQAELGRKDRQIREAVQRYTRTIADLESKLEEETHQKIELEDRLSSARSELEDKQKQTQELIQKQTKGVMKLESDMSKASIEKEELRAKLEQTMKDLDQKRREHNQTVTKFSTEVSELRSVKQEHSEYKEMSDATRSELERKEKEVSEMKMKIPELMAQLDTKSRECDEQKADAKRFETELGKRKEQLNGVVARYADQISELEAQLDEQSVARSSTQDRVETVKAEATRKEQKLRELHQKIVDLESKLEAANKNREASRQKIDGIARELDDREAEVRTLEMEKIELETKLHAHSRSKDEMRAKVSDMSSRLERKEREVREVTDRYKMYIMELESKLDQDTDAKHHLQMEVDKLKTILTTAAGVSNEASGLREQVYALEASVDEFRAKLRESESKAKSAAKSLGDRLASASMEKEEVESMLKKANSEKSEVIAALEGVINEVQNREDEIESLSELLHRRDEELEHAKIIATKALQSAKDIQKRYKDKDKDRESVAYDQIDELNDNINELTSKNDTLNRKISTLERDHRDKNLECKRLKEQLKQFDVNQLRDIGSSSSRPNDDSSAFSARLGMKDDASAFSTQSTYCSSRSFSNAPSTSSGGPGSFRIDTDSLGPEDEMGMAAESFSPSASASPQSQSDDDMFDKESNFPPFEKQAPGDLSDDAGNCNSTIATSENGRWRESDNESRYDNESRSGFDSVASDNSMSKSRKSIERDALRRYVANKLKYRKRGDASL
jgi:chromosome segregation protein